MSANEQYIVGVDLGGTNIVAGALTADGTKHLAMRSIPTNSSVGDEGVADRIVGLVQGVILDTIEQNHATRRDFIGIGIGAPGPLDRERGIVLVAPNLGWKDFPLRQRIQDRLNLATAGVCELPTHITTPEQRSGKTLSSFLFSETQVTSRWRRPLP